MALLVRLRHRRRRRFRNRVLAAMLVVSLLPLAIFAAVVAADVGSVSRSTVDSANRSILDDAERNQQAQLATKAQNVATILDNVSAQLLGLRDRMAALLRGAAPAPASATALPPLTLTGSLAYVPDEHPPGSAMGSTVMVGGAALAGSRDRTVSVAGAWRDSAEVEPAMEAVRGANRAVQFVWMADPETTLVRVLPSIPVVEDLSTGRLSPESPLAGMADGVFSAMAAQPGMAGEGASWDGEPSGPTASDVRPAFTTTYDTGVNGVIGMTLWMAVGGGSHYRLGIDLDVRQLLGDAVTAPASDQRGAYNVLLDSSGRLLGGGDAVARDFALPPGSEWGRYLVPADQGLHQQLDQALRAGGQRTIDTTLGGQRKLLLTAPLAGAHWVLASVVPADGLIPDQPGLSKGIEEGLSRILRDAVPVAAGLCALAFILASLLARRVVAPVRALTVAAERLGSGDTEAPVPPAGRDEVGLLAVSLERMRREVNASRDAILAAARELEGRVEERTAELRDRNEELVALNALAGSLTRSLDPQVILEGALDTLRVVLPVRAGRAFVLNEERLEARVAWDDGATGVAGRNGDAAAAEREQRPLAETARAALREHDLTLSPAPDGTLIGIPLEAGGGALGAIALLAQPGWTLGMRTRALVRTVGDQVGLALRTAALSAEGRELAVLEERTRLAREIHDTIAQQLTAVVLQLEAAEAFVERDSGRARKVVVAARDLARSALQEARQSVWNLRPPSLDRTGLAGAIAIEAARWQRRTGIEAVVRADELPRSAALPPQTEVALFRIVQEALSNVERHSHAHRVEVCLQVDAAELGLRVRDDGDGFDPGRPAPGTFGLLGMEERARLIGAVAAVTSAPGQGTEVSVTLPLAGVATAVKP